MKAYQNTTLGLRFEVMVPETAEEFDNMAGLKGQCAAEAIRNVIYRTVNHEFRKAFCERLEKETGVPRKIKEVKRGDKVVEEYDETEQTYYNRLLAAKDIDEERAQLIANEIGKTLVFDPSPTTRSAKVPKELQDACNGILAAVEAKTTTAATVMAKFAAALGIESFEASYGAFNEESLIRALIADRDKQHRERLNKFV